VIGAQQRRSIRGAACGQDAIEHWIAFPETGLVVVEESPLHMTAVDEIGLSALKQIQANRRRAREFADRRAAGDAERADRPAFGNRHQPIGKPSFGMCVKPLLLSEHYPLAR
jgi:hypothetical protein